MGFTRTLQPPAPPVVISIDEAVDGHLERLLAIHFPERDPFNVADRCPFNATGHQTIVSCGDVVCCHCSKVFWK